MQKIFVAAMLFLNVHSYVHAMEDEFDEKEKAAQTTKEAQPSQAELETVTANAALYNWTPLQAAINEGSVPLVKWYLTHVPQSKKMPYPPFLQAIVNKKFDVAYFLLTEGADINEAVEDTRQTAIPLVEVARNVVSEVAWREKWLTLFEKMLEKKVATKTKNGSYVLDEIISLRNAVSERLTKEVWSSDMATLVAHRLGTYDEIVCLLLQKDAPSDPKKPFNRPYISSAQEKIRKQSQQAVSLASSSTPNSFAMHDFNECL